MTYLGKREEITNGIARELTGIKCENQVKDVFYRLRDRGLIERAPEKLGKSAAWRKK